MNVWHPYVKSWNNSNTSFRKKKSLNLGMKKKSMEKGLFLCFFLLFCNVKNIRDSLSFLLPCSMGPFQLCKIGIHSEVLLKCSDKSMFHRRQSKKILHKYSIYSRTGGKFQHEKWDWYPTDVLCLTV